MFTITPTNKEDLEAAMRMIDSYPSIDYMLEKTGSCFLITVFDAESEEDLRLCEIEFQMNFHTKPGLVCERCGLRGESICGHLSFTSLI